MLSMQSRNTTKLRPKTPLVPIPVEGVRAHVKDETKNLTRSFKIRGVRHYIDSLSPGEQRQGIVVASSGSLAIATAYYCRARDVPCTVVMPANTPEKKRARLQWYKCPIMLCGRDYNDAAEAGVELANTLGRTFLHTADERLIEGNRAVAEEVLYQMPSVDVIVTPIGGGSLVSAIVDECGLSVDVMGVQDRAYPWAYNYFRRKKFPPHPVIPDLACAAGIAVREGTENVKRRLDYLADCQVVHPDDIAWAQKLLKDACNISAEAAGAASLAVAHKDTFAMYYRGQTVVFIITGDNE